MIEVELPDKNTTLQFPDGMDPSEMDRLIRERFYPESQEMGGAIGERPLETLAPAPERELIYKKPEIPPFNVRWDKPVSPPEITEQVEPAKKPLPGLEAPEPTFGDKFAEAWRYIKEPWKYPEKSEAMLEKAYGPYRKAIDKLAEMTEWTPEEEQKRMEEHPNFWAARYALLKAITFDSDKLIPGATWLISPEDWKEFEKKSTPEQHLEIVGEATNWILSIGAIKAGGGLGKIALKKIPVLDRIFNAPIGASLKKWAGEGAGRYWWERATNRERALMVMGVDEMKKAGWSDADILKGLRSNPDEFTKYRTELMKERGFIEKVEDEVEPFKIAISEKYPKDAVLKVGIYNASPKGMSRVPGSGEAYLDSSGKVILDGEKYSVGDKAYLWKDKFYKSPPEDLIKYAKENVDMASGFIDTAKRAMWKINWKETDLAKRYSNLSNYERQVARDIEKYIKSPDEQKLMESLYADELKKYEFEVGGRLHIPEGPRQLTKTQKQALKSYNASGGQFGITAVKSLEEPTILDEYAKVFPGAIGELGKPIDKHITISEKFPLEKPIPALEAMRQKAEEEKAVEIPEESTAIPEEVKAEKEPITETVPIDEALPKKEQKAEFLKALDDAIEKAPEKIEGREITPGLKMAKAADYAMPQMPTKEAEAVPLGAFKPIPEGLKRSSVIKAITKRLGVPVRHGKYRFNSGGMPKSGVYKPGARVIRLKRPNNLPTAVHESAHDFQKLLGLSDKMPKEVQNMAYPGAKNVDREGFAEFVRYYVTSPTKAKNEAPGFYETFEDALSRQKDVQDLIIQARQAWEVWESSPSVSKIHSFLKRGGGRKKLPTMSQLYTSLKDALWPLKLAEREAERLGADLSILERPYAMARLTRGWTRKAEQYAKIGTFQYAKEGIKLTGPPLVDILKPIEDKGQTEMLDVYLIAKRAMHDPRILRGFSGMLSKKDFKQAVMELEPLFKDVAQKLYVYQDELITFLTDSGRISKSTAEIIRKRNLFYAPFYRVMDYEASTSGLSSKNFSQIINPIKKLKGSSRDIYSPTESMLYNTYVTINAAERNRVGNALRALSWKPEMGKVIERVPFPIRPIKMSREEALQSLGLLPKGKTIETETQELFLDLLDSIPLDELNEIAITFRPKYTARPEEAIFYNEGKPELYELSPDLGKAITNIDAGNINALIKILAFPAKLLRAGATTFSPEFGLRNPTRDQLSAFIQSEYGYIPGFDFIRGIYHMMNQTPLWQKFNASGAAHSTIVSIDRNYLARNLKKLYQESSLKGYAKNPLKGLQAFSEYTEEASRVAEFARAFKKHGGDYRAMLEAGLAGREVTIDFARQGGSSARALNMISAFWNARLEGLDKMGRTFKRHPMKASVKAFLGVTLPSIYLWYSQKDDPYFQELPSWRRVLFWNIVFHKDDGSLDWILSIPKPFEYGLLFGSIPEAALDWAYKDDPQGFKDAMDQVLQTFKLIPLPTATIPAAEWWANKSLYFDRPLEPRGTEELEPALRYGPYTSETIKLTTEIMNEVPGLKEIANPAKIENLIKGYTGGFGRLALDAADWSLKTFGVIDAPPDPEMKLADIPGIRAFAARFPTAHTKSIEIFYKEYNKMRREWESKKQRRGVRGYGIKGLGEYRPEKLVKYELVAKSLTTKRKIALIIYKRKNIDPDKKRLYLDNIFISMSNLAGSALGRKPMQKMTRK